MKCFQNLPTTFQEQNGDRQSHFLEMRDLVIHKHKHSYDEGKSRQEVKFYKLANKTSAQSHESDFDRSLLMNHCKVRVRPIRLDSVQPEPIIKPSRSQSYVFNPEKIFAGVKITQTGFNKAKNFLSLAPLSQTYVQNGTNATQSQPSTRNQQNNSIIEPEKEKEREREKDKENFHFDIIKIKRQVCRGSIGERQEKEKPIELKLVSIRQPMQVKDRNVEKQPMTSRSRAYSFKLKKKPQPTKEDQLIKYVTENEYIIQQLQSFNIDQSLLEYTLRKPDLQLLLIWKMSQVDIPQANTYKWEEKLTNIKRQVDEEICKLIKDEIELQQAENHHQQQKQAMFRKILDYRTQMTTEYNYFSERLECGSC